VSIFATAIVGLMLVVPGMAASLVIYRPGRIHLPTRLASVFGFGYAVVAIVATVLTNLRAMKPTPFFVLLGASTAALWGAALWRRDLGAHARAIRDDVREEPWPLLLGFVVIVFISVVRWRFSPLVNFGHTEPWRYWADAQEIARLGHVPTSVIQYGMRFPPTVSKIMLNAYNAGVIFAIGPAALPAMGALTWLVALGSNVALWGIGREFGLRYTAPLFVVLTQAEPRWAEPTVTTKIVYHYNATYVGRMVALCALAVGIRAIRDRRWNEVVAVGVLFGVAAGTHLIPVAIFGAMLAWYAVGYILAHRHLVKPVLSLLVIAALTGGIAFGAISTAGGDVGFQGAGGASKYSNFPPTFDPTLYLSNGVVKQPPDEQPAARDRLQHGWYLLPGQILTDFVASATRFTPSERLAFGLCGVALLLALSILFFFPPRLRPLGVTAWGFGATLIAASLGLSWVYRTLVPGAFGERRLDNSMIFCSIIIAVAFLEAAIWLVRRLNRIVGTVSGLVVIAAAIALTIPVAGPPRQVINQGHQSVAALEWIARNTPRNTRIAASRRTAGTFEAVAHRVSLTEGMSPYLRPAMLKLVVHKLLEARKYFNGPLLHPDYPHRHRVEYVVFIDGNEVGSVGGILGYPVRDKFRRAPFLRLMFHNASVDIYRVTGQ
jgi:hypothetical protein